MGETSRGENAVEEFTYFEDFVVGAVLETAGEMVTEEDIIKFATQFDPQPMHIDPAAAEKITGGLIASGWHTASMTMRLLISGRQYRPAPGTLGLGFESLKWLKPVRPGDTLRLRLELIAVRESESKPGWGIITNRFTTLNQHGEAVQQMVSSAIVPKRNK
jgi:acyl dehydratase